MICYIYYYKKNLTTEDITRLKKWFWTSSFSSRYRGASESFVSNDLKCIFFYFDAHLILLKMPADKYGDIVFY